MVENSYSGIYKATIKAYKNNKQAFNWLLLFFSTTSLGANLSTKKLEEIAKIAKESGLEASSLNSTKLLIFCFLGLTMFVGVLVSSMIIKITEKSLLQQKISVFNSLKLTLPKFFPILLASMLFVIASMAGFMFLIIPGIYIMIRGMLFSSAIIIDNENPLSSFKTSWRMMKGHLFKYAVLYMPVLMVIIFSKILEGILTALPFQILFAVIAGANAIVLVILTTVFYISLKQNQDTAQVSQPFHLES